MLRFRDGPAFCCLMLLAVAAGVAGVAVPVAGQVEIRPPAEPVTVEPGDLATLVFTLTQSGDRARTFELDAMLPDGMSLIAPLSPIGVAPGAREPVFVTVAVDVGVEAGPTEIRLEARAADDAALRATAVGIVEVLATHRFRIAPPATQTVERGSTAELPFAVTNRGNVIEQLALMAEAPAGWSVEVDPTGLELLPGETREVQVLVRLPQAIEAIRHRVALVARSLRVDTEVSETATLRVRPPGPEDVDGTLDLQVPTRLALQATSSDGGPPHWGLRLHGRTRPAPGRLVDYRLTVANLAEPLDVRGHIELEGARFGGRVGDLSLPLAPGVGLTGPGAQLTVKGGATSRSRATLGLARGSGDAIQVGGHAAIGIGDVTPSFGARVHPASGTMIGAFGLDAELPLIDEVSTVAALSRGSGEPFDVAWQLVAERAFGPFGLSAEASYAGPGFLGSPRDQISMEIRQRLRHRNATLNAHASGRMTNIGADPSRPSPIETDLGTSMRLSFTDRTSLAGRFDLAFREDAFVPTKIDDISQEIGILLTQRLGPARLTAGYERHETRDDVAAQIDVETAWSATGSLALGPVLPTFHLERRSHWDGSSHALLKRWHRAEAGVRVRLPHASLSFGLAHRPEERTVSAGFRATPGAFSVSSDGRLRWTDAATPEASAQVTVGVTFPVPLPFWPVRSRVAGRVFVEGDPSQGIAEAVIAVGGRFVRTDERGRFRTPPLAPGSQSLTLERLPLGLSPAVELPIDLELAAGEERDVAIPVTQEGVIRGIVFDDRNEDGQRQTGEPGLDGIRVHLAGAASRETVTAGDGRFVITAPTGHHTVGLDETTLPPRFEPTTPVDVNVDLHRGETVTIAFGAVEVVQVRFAPMAAFSVSTASPRVGDAVTFDAAGSIDPDGEIVAYDWDFDGDGQPDAHGSTVNHAFAEPGEHEVTLTVTDDDGQQDSTSQRVEVGESFGLTSPGAQRRKAGCLRDKAHRNPKGSDDTAQVRLALPRGFEPLS